MNMFLIHFAINNNELYSHQPIFYHTGVGRFRILGGPMFRILGGGGKGGKGGARGAKFPAGT